jgi:nickel/cobalt exporter
MKQITHLVVILFLITPHNVYSQDNPFLSSENEQNETQTRKQNRTSIRIPFLTGQFRQIVKIQRDLYVKLSQTIKDIKEGNSPYAYPLLALVVFLYGIIHAAGPGHGKVFVMSYFLSRRAPLLKGFMFAFSVAFMHAAISSLAVLVTYFVLERGVMSSLDNTQNIMMIISYSFIIAAGFFLLVTAIINKGHHNHGEDRIEFDSRHFFSMAFSIAMTPCPATILILLFALTNGLVLGGIFAVVFLAFGMGLTLGVVALVTIGTSEGSISILSRYTTLGKQAGQVMSFIGPLLIITIGSIFLTAQFL